MQPVSAHYNAYPDVREVGVGVTFRLVDVGAAGNAAVLLFHQHQPDGWAEALGFLYRLSARHRREADLKYLFLARGE